MGAAVLAVSLVGGVLVDLDFFETAAFFLVVVTPFTLPVDFLVVFAAGLTTLTLAAAVGV